MTEFSIDCDQVAQAAKTLSAYLHYLDKPKITDTSDCGAERLAETVEELRGWLTARVAQLEDSVTVAVEDAMNAVQEKLRADYDVARGASRSDYLV